MTIRRRSSNVRVFRLEDLESREMLAGHGLGAGFSHLAAATQFARFQAAQVDAGARFAAVNQVFAALGSSYAGGTLLTANLSDSETGETAKVTYKSYVEEGETETQFKVTVTGAAADTTLDVTLGDTVVGQIATDSSGAGSLKLSSDPEDDEQALPDNFPTDIAAGTAVSVGSLSGTLATPTRSRHGCGAQRTVLSAPLTDSEGTATGTASYTTSTKHDETATRLTVTVSGAAASSTLDVAIDGTTVGQLATDAEGAGSLVLSSNPSGTEQPLPANFPAITAGSTITVGTLSGTFAEDTTSVTFTGFRLGRRR